MCENTKFIDSILTQTSNKEQLQYRFRVWEDTLVEIIWSWNSEVRFFSYDKKKRLYEDNSSCKICWQQIVSIDDSEVDHILPYSKWGKTDIENAQLTHRYCNRHKNNTL